MRAPCVYTLLLAVKGFARAFYRVELRWVNEVEGDPWSGVRLAGILNHTSLYEPLFAGGVPDRFLRQMAREGVIPAADVTLRRPVVGAFYRLVARHVLPITRERDATWEAVVEKAGPESLVILLPEGRMKRATGLDKHGRPMTVRGGIADLIRTIPEGRMLLAYSAGLHHVHAPGQLLPRLFKTIRMRLEALDITAYRKELETRAAAAGSTFKREVIRDLEARRDRHCCED